MNRKTVAALLSFVGTLLFVSLGFDLLPNNMTIFMGIACFMAAGLAWWLPLDRSPRK